jgi:hypothetical protein
MNVILLNDRNDTQDKICHQENIKHTVGRAKAVEQKLSTLK